MMPTGNLGDAAMDGRDKIMALHAAVGDFAKALVSGDIGTLNSLLSSSYQHTDRLGQLWRRDEWLAQAGPDTERPNATDWGHFTATLMGDLGIVVGTKHLHGPDVTEPPTAYTALRIWRNERWLRALFQETPIVETGAP